MEMYVFPYIILGIMDKKKILKVHDATPKTLKNNPYFFSFFLDV
jgi:hypothetical protein